MTSRCRYIGTSLFVFLACFSTGCKLYKASPDTAFLGDSITQGWAYPSVNLGIFGNTTGQMAARFPSQILGHHYKQVVILGGTNDVLLGIDSAVRSFVYQHLREMGHQELYLYVVGENLAGLRIAQTWCNPAGRVHYWKSSRSGQILLPLYDARGDTFDEFLAKIQRRTVFESLGLKNSSVRPGQKSKGFSPAPIVPQTNVLTEDRSAGVQWTLLRRS